MGLLEKFRRIIASDPTYSKRDKADWLAVPFGKGSMIVPLRQRTAGAVFLRTIPMKVIHRKHNASKKALSGNRTDPKKLDF